MKKHLSVVRFFGNLICFDVILMCSGEPINIIMCDFNRT
jgi:hypothetical protein